MSGAADTQTGDDFEVDVSRRSGVDVVTVRGDLDIATSARLGGIVADPTLCPQPGLVVDLTHVGFLDSTGVGALITAWRRTALRDARFGVTCPAGPALRVLRLVGLDQVFDVWATMDDALGVLELA